jgi:L-lysine 2,3-aminomutase
MGEPRNMDNALRSWQEELRFAYRTASDLAREGFIAEGQIPSFERLLKRFPMVLPTYYAGLIDRSDPNCPIRRQAIPQLRELEA